MVGLFHLFVYQPVYNVIIFFAGLFPGASFGLAIVGTTILIKVIFLSLSKKQIEAQKKMQEIQPKIKEIQEKFKDDKEKQSKALMQFYKENKVNPFAGCFPLIIQILFFITIYRIIMKISETGFSVDGSILYSFISNPGTLSHVFLGVDLSMPSKLFAIFSAIAQFYQMKMLMLSKPKKEKKDGEQADFATIMNQQMLYMGPILTLWIGFTFPAALSLYWLVSTVFAIIQQWYMFRKRAAYKRAKAIEPVKE